MLVAAGEWMRDLLELHLEELEWLWRQRAEAWRSPAYDLTGLVHLDERVMAHSDALVLAGEDALPLVLPLIEEADDAFKAMGAAYVLLSQMEPDLTQRALKGFQELEPDSAPFGGFQLALRYAHPSRYEKTLQQITQGASSSHVVAATAALAFHGRLQEGERLLELVQSENPDVRRVAWEAVSLLKVAGSPPHERILLQRMGNHLQAAVRKELVPAVRQAVWVAAAWTRQNWLLEHLRHHFTKTGDLGSLRLLAVLAPPAELAFFLDIGHRQDLGVERFSVLAGFGHPQVAEVLLKAMESGGPLAAAKAAQAFQRMAGVSVETAQRVELRLEDQDGNIDQDSSPEEVRIPDAVLARKQWERIRRKLPGATRLCYGEEAARGGPPEWLERLPMDVRWEMALRERFETGRGEGPAALERFPCTF